MKTVYINEVSGSWILNIIGNDIYNILNSLGYICRKGNYEDYRGEEISLHMWWRHAQPYKEAKINSVFITHCDDKVKEHDLLDMKDKFDLFFCMSPEDAIFLKELGFNENRVFGLNLPCRNTYVKPITIGIFSNCYKSMKTKNEDWLLEYCIKNPKSQIVDFCFIGHGWGDVVNTLAQNKCSFQWHCVDRNLPYEYMYQQLKLTGVDYYIYMGMDGGAMGTYDAYAMGSTLCVADDGFHKGIPDLSLKFNNQSEFNNVMDIIIDRQIHKLDFFVRNNVEHYVKNIAFVFENQKYPEDLLSYFPNINYSVAEKRQSNYFSLTFERLRQPLVSLCIKYMNRKKLKKQTRDE